MQFICFWPVIPFVLPYPTLDEKLTLVSSQAEVTISREGGRPYPKAGPVVRLTWEKLQSVFFCCHLWIRFIDCFFIWKQNSLKTALGLNFQNIWFEIFALLLFRKCQMNLVFSPVGYMASRSLSPSLSRSMIPYLTWPTNAGLALASLEPEAQPASAVQEIVEIKYKNASK